MAVSQNGWAANERHLVASREVPGTNVSLTVRKGPAGTALIYVAEQFDKRVESISNARGGLDDWGYAERPIRGSTTISNHASGTAIDLNATKHPLGAENTFSDEQVQEIRKILNELGNVVRWGGDYRNRKDEMHFEINKDGNTVKTAVNNLPTVQEVEEVFVKHGDTGEEVKYVQLLLKEAGESLPKYGADKDYGDETAEAITSFWKKQTGKDYDGQRVTAWVLLKLHAAVFGGSGSGVSGDYVTKEEYIGHRHPEGRTGTPK